MSFEFEHPIDGSPVVIEHPLLPEYIQEGRLLWYWGFTSVSGWDCPAVITEVDTKNQKFKVRSLDDMKEQRQLYSFICDKGSPTSRKTMRLASKEEVASYLDERQASLKKRIRYAGRKATSSRGQLNEFEKQRAALSL